MDAPKSPAERSPPRREATSGILRLDLSKPRRNSGSSVEFRSPPERLGDSDLCKTAEPPSPQPSVDRLSVSFAPEDSCYLRMSAFAPGSPPSAAVEKVHFSREPTVTDVEDEDEEDYSASVCAILQRRATSRRQSNRRRNRRPSSPFSPDVDSAHRRRSSVFTTSSGETAVSMEEGATQEQIYENLRLHKEVLSSVKQQPWGMRRKLRLVQLAKAYVKRHEGELQERLAQSKSTRDILASCNIILIKKWQYMKRELANLVNVLIPWELRIKEIESHFGSVVASYFTFLRWLFWVNLVITVLLAAFVAIPEMLTADPNKDYIRKKLLPEEEAKATNLITLWDFEGVLKYSPIFYGYYTKEDFARNGYRLPFAYFMTGLAVYIYSFVATLKRMAENSRMSKLSEKDDECVFTWKLFTGWDYMIGNAETAHNRAASIILGFKEALLEEAEKKRNAHNWKIIGLRVLVNFTVLALLAASAYAVVEVVKRSTEPARNASWWRQNEITMVLTMITFIYPIIFEVLGFFECFHPRKQLRLQLARIMVLNLLNLYTLIFALFGKISLMTKDLQKLNTSTSTESTSDISEWSAGSTLSIAGPTILASPNTTASVMMIVTVVSGGAPHVISNISSFLNTTSAQEPTTASVANTEHATTTNSVVTNLFGLDAQLPGNLSELSSIPTTTVEQVEVNCSITDDEYAFNFTIESISESNNSSDNTSTDDFIDHYSTYSNESAVSTSEGDGSAMDVTEAFNVSTASVHTASTLRLNLDANTSVQGRPTVSTLLTPLSHNNDGILEQVSEAIQKMPGMPRSSRTENVMEEQQTSSTASPGKSHDSSEMLTSQPPEPIDVKTQKELRRLCWETMFGQELVKLTVMDLVVTVSSTLIVDFIRAVFVRVMNSCWCWDLEKQFPQYGDFKIAENILHLVNNQGMVWMGMFFAPGLPLLNLLKLVILMYLRSWAVLTCNVPHEVVFRASRSNNFYFALLLIMLFLCVLPVGYAIVWVQPSRHCGPFSGHKHIYHIFTKSLQNALPRSLHRALDYIASPGTVIPLLLLLVLVIYYLVSLTGALREANNDLKIQLRRERTEERRKMFQLVHRRRRGGSGADGSDTPYNRWRKILPVMPSKPLPGVPAKEGENDADGRNNTAALGNGNIKNDINRSELLSRIMKRALRKSSATSDEESLPIVDGDGTDIELHDSLSDDKPKAKAAVKGRPRFEASGSGMAETSFDVEQESARKPAHHHHRKRSEHRHKSPSSSSTNKEREDSVTSAWSDNIPVIRISNSDEYSQQRAEPQRATKTTEPVHRPVKSPSADIKAITGGSKTEVTDTQAQHKGNL